MKVLLLLTLLSSFSFGQHLQKPCPTETWDATTGKCVARPPKVDPGTIVFDLCGWGESEAACTLEYIDTYNTGLPTEYNLTAQIELTPCHTGYHHADLREGSCYKSVPSGDGCNVCTFYQDSQMGSCTAMFCTHAWTGDPKPDLTVESPVVPPLSDDEIRELRILINDWNRLNF